MINSLRCGYSNAAELKRVIELLIMERVQFLTELHSFCRENEEKSYVNRDTNSQIT
jgi:hypothetical protein